MIANLVAKSASMLRQPLGFDLSGLHHRHHMRA